MQEMKMRIYSEPFYAETFGRLAVAFVWALYYSLCRPLPLRSFSIGLSVISGVLWILSFSFFAAAVSVGNCHPFVGSTGFPKLVSCPVPAFDSVPLFDQCLY